MDKRSAWMRALPLAATAAVLALYGYRQIWLLAAVPAGARDKYPTARIHQANDFKHLYFGAVLVRMGESPYDETAMRQMARLAGVSVNPYVYLPFTAQAMWPLSYLTLRRAIETWFVFNQFFLLSSLALIALAWPSCRHQAAFVALVLVGAGWYPLTRTLTAGQLNCALLFLIAAHWRAAERGWNWLAGLALALAALFKIAPAFLILALLLQRRRRLLDWSVGWGAVLLLASVLWCGPGRYLEFIPVLRQMGYGESTWADVGFDFYRQPFNQSFNAFFHRALTQNPATQPLINAGPDLANALTVGVSLALLLGAASLIMMNRGREFLRQAGEDGQREMNDLDLAISVIVMLLLPSLYWDHYGVLLLLPGAIIAQYSRHWWTLALVAVASALIAIPQGFFFSLAPSPPHGVGVLLFSMELWGTLLLLAVAVALRLSVASSIQREAQGQGQGI